MAFDVIAALCSYLPQKTGVPCYSNVPKTRPDEFLTIERTGGGYELGKDEPNLAIQCWSTTESMAYTLALAVREAVRLSREYVDQICRVEIGSIYNFPDPDSKMWRYQVNVYLVTRP